jgi:L-2-hydroxycarboxylate dehydrogenase (NAD+)
VLFRSKGQERIYTAGEKEHLAWLERKEKRGAPINASVRRELEDTRNRLNVDFRFVWES